MATVPSDPMVGEYIVQPTNRLYGVLSAWFVAMGTFFYATAAVAGLKPAKPGEFGTLVCNAAPLQVWFQLHGLVESAVQGTAISEIKFVISHIPAPAPKGVKTAGFTTPMAAIQMALFGNFVEAHLEWMDTTYGKDLSNHPDLFKFARTVRNACAHGGVIRINNQRSPPTVWRGLKYAATENGRRVINADVSGGDLVLLMVELGMELDRLNAPPP